MSTSGQSGKSGQGAERRRYARLPISLDALIALKGRGAVPCEVRDFCIAGMFIRLGPHLIKNIVQQTPATLYFALVVDGVQTDYQIKIVVARVIPAGLGVAFDNPDPEILRLLRRLAGPPDATAPLEALGKTQSRFAPEFLRLVEPLTELARSHIGQIGAEFLRLADAALFLGARDAGNNAEQRKYIDGQAELRDRHKQVEKTIAEMVEKGISILNNPLDRNIDREADGGAGSSTLSLIDIDEFEEFLTVSEVVSVLEPKYKEPLYDLDKRLSYLANREIDERSNPVGPAVICNVFAEALKGLQSDRVAVNTIYKSLQQSLEAHLPRLYTDANALLVNEGILPVVEKEKTVIKRQPSADAGSAATPGSPVASAQGPGLGETMIGQVGVQGPPQGPPPAPTVVQPGMVMPGQIQAPGMMGQGGGFGVFGNTPAVYAAPTFEQAYSAAQTQLALKRQIMPHTAGPGGAPGMVTGHYSPSQIVDGLSGLQESLAATGNPQLFDLVAIKERIVDAVSGAGGERMDIGETESDEIEVIANLFQALLEDSLLTDAAKSHLMRLQAPVHKAALIDGAFFESTDHPVRQLLNRIAQVRSAKGEEGAAQNARITGLVQQVNNEFQRDLSVFGPVLKELEAILERQSEAYSRNVTDVIKSCEDQQTVLQARREKSFESTDEMQARMDLPAEWNKWLDRCKALEVGERLIMNANSRSPCEITLAWLGEDYNPYVFVDDVGNKIATLTLQQLAMNFRRGIIKPLKEERGDAVGRALYGMVNRIHEQVEEQATMDELTGFLTRKAFLQVIERRLPDKNAGDRGAVLCQLAIDNLKSVNDHNGVEAGDELIDRVAGLLREKLASKVVSFGRLGGGELGVFWERGGLKSAYKKVQSCFDSWTEATIDRNGVSVAPDLSGGITAIQDAAVKPERLLEIVAEACKVARDSSDQSLCVTGGEDRHREQLKQMVSYVGRAIDSERLVLLSRKVTSVADGDALPALHVVVSAKDRNGKLVPPEMFMAAVASSERAFEIDQWVLRRTLSWMAEHSQALDAFAAVIIPLSRAAIGYEDPANFIINELMQTPVPPGKICFEVRDQDVVASLVETTELIRTLREFGCRFVLDEFGSGQQQYDYVKELAVDFVSIQSVFVKGASTDPKDFAMAKSINELIHFMGIKSIAKQDADIDLTDTLAAIGVNFMYDLSHTDEFVD